MANKLQLIGNLYQFHAEGNWPYIAQATRAMKDAISSTIRPPRRDFDALFSIFGEQNVLERRILEAFFVPKEEESFGEYKQRFIHGLGGEGLRGWLAGFLMGKKMPFEYDLKTSNGDRLSLDLKVREKQFDCTLGVSGIYSPRGELIAQKIRSTLAALPLEYNATPMLVTRI